jgi:hypothetical protein
MTHKKSYTVIDFY